MKNSNALAISTRPSWLRMALWCVSATLVLIAGGCASVGPTSSECGHEICWAFGQVA